MSSASLFGLSLRSMESVEEKTNPSDALFCERLQGTRTKHKVRIKRKRIDKNV